MNTDQPRIDLPDAVQLLGTDYDPTWDYVWVLPTTVPFAKRQGFIVKAGPVQFYYGAEMYLVGRLRKDNSAND